MELYEVIESIEDSILKLLKGARLGVDNINWGDRTRVNQFRPPLVWLYLSDSRPNYSGRAEMWSFDFEVIGVVDNDDPYGGWREANRLAGRAASTLVKSYTLDNPRIRWVKRTGYQPVNVRFQQKQLQAVAFTMQIGFLFKEPPREE